MPALTIFLTAVRLKSCGILLESLASQQALFHRPKITGYCRSLAAAQLEDMVEVLPRKGMIVKPVSLHDVLEIIEVRLVNESYCVRLAAERADRGELEAMAEVLTRAQSDARTEHRRDDATGPRVPHLPRARGKKHSAW